MKMKADGIGISQKSSSRAITFDHRISLACRVFRT